MTRRRIIRIALGVASFIVLLIVAVVVLVAAGFLRAPEVRAVRLRWGDVTPRTTGVVAEVGLRNPGRMGWRAPGVSLKVPVHFYDVEVLSLGSSGLRLPRGQSTLRLDGVFRQEEVTRWWPEFVRRREKLAIAVRPQLKVLFIQKELQEVETTVSVPLLDRMRSTGPRSIGFDTVSPLALLRDPGSHLVVGQTRPAIPLATVESWELHWGVTAPSPLPALSLSKGVPEVGEGGGEVPSRSQVLGTVTVRNDTVFPIPVLGLRVGMDMNAVPVLPETRLTPRESVLAPGASTQLAIEGYLDNSKLAAWWTSHLQNKEQTLIVVRLGLSVRLPAAILPGGGDAFDLPLIPGGFQCRVQTDLLGAANAEIARSLGQPPGPPPPPASSQCGEGEGS